MYFTTNLPAKNCTLNCNWQPIYDASAAPIMQNLGWSTISNLVRKETATLTYKSLNSLAPDYLRKLFAKCSVDRERFLRSSETDLKIPLLKTISGQKAFSYRGAKLWNSLERASKIGPLPENVQRSSIVGDNSYFIFTFSFYSLSYI